MTDEAQTPDIAPGDMDEVHTYLLSELNNANQKIAQLQSDKLTLIRQNKLYSQKIIELQNDPEKK